MTLPISNGTYINIAVDWGDELIPYNFIIDNQGLNRPSYAYEGPRQLRQITVTGELPNWSFSNDLTANELLVSIDEYGGLEIANGGNQFEDCIRLSGFPTEGELDLPLNCHRMFSGCTLLIEADTLNTAAVEDMSFMFSGCDAFNGDILNWNVQEVTNMSFMFFGCEAFTGVGDADAPRIFGIPGNNVLNMGNMFQGCSSFNGDLSDWNVQGVRDMSGMFLGCTAFTGVGEGDAPRIFGIPGPRVENLDMADMFNGCTHFNGDISEWDVQRVTNMAGIFTGCIDFRRDVSTWIMTGIQNNESVPSFTNEYIAEVNPAFSTGDPDAWNFSDNLEFLNRNVINFILPVNSRKLYYIDGDLRLRRATDGRTKRSRSRFSQSVIMPSYKTVIMKSYI